MNISPVNGFIIKHKEAEKLRKEVEDFLGGVSSKKKKPVEKKSQWRENINDVMIRNNFRSAKERDERLKIQRPYFLEFYEVFKGKAWSTLNKEINNLVSAQHLYCVFDGQNSIAVASKFDVVKAAMRKLIDEKELEDAVNAK